MFFKGFKITMYRLVIPKCNIQSKKSKVKWNETGYRKWGSKSLFETQCIVCTHPSTNLQAVPFEKHIFCSARSKQACNPATFATKTETALNKEGEVLKFYVPLTTHKEHVLIRLIYTNLFSALCKCILKTLALLSCNLSEE